MHDPELAVGATPGAKQRLQKGAYFYPIYSRTALRPKRNVGPTAINPQQDEERIDDINLRVVEMDEESREGVLGRIAEVDPGSTTATAA